MRLLPAARHLATVAAAALGLTLAATPSAHAALISTGACDDAALTTPFAKWGDTSSYKLVPGGDFEGSLSGWTLTGGAKVVAGGANGSAHALSLPPGASVTSPKTCVNTSYPKSRVFARTSGLSTVVAQVVYRVPLLGDVALPVGALALSPAWSPSLPLVTGSVAVGLLSNGTAQVGLRFTALTGTSQIDDVYVDPRMR